ncbi:MAG: hypothetical protein U1D30_11935 [Planctomycetota bacterium]
MQDPDPLEQFIWHPYYIDGLVTRFYDADVTDMTGPVQHYFTHDANFNITTALNTSGDPVERYDYTLRPGDVPQLHLRHHQPLLHRPALPLHRPPSRRRWRSLPLPQPAA